MQHSVERRKHQRFHISQFIDIALDRETFEAADGVNISESGLLLRTGKRFDPYDRVFVMVTLEMPEGPSVIRFNGIVIRSTGSGGHYDTGISITDIPDDEREVLRKFCHIR